MKKKLLLPLLVILYLFLNLYCVFNESPIWDEPLQLKVGLMFWKTKQFILEPVEPPLSRLITSLPVFFFGQKAVAGKLGKIYFYPRLIVILIGCLFLIFFFQVLKELFDEKLAILGTILFIFEPNLLTHSHYNTTDFIFTVLFFSVIYFLTKKDYLFGYLPIFLGLLYATKVSAPILFISTLVLIFLFKKIYLWHFFKKEISLARVFLFLSLFLFSFWACYLFKIGPAISENTKAVAVEYQYYIFENKPFWLNIFKKSLPFSDYLATFKFAVQYQKAGFDAYFAGNYSRYGWWWYFPVVFLLKTPLPLLILFILSFTRCHLYQGDTLIKKRFYFLIPILAIMFLSLFLRINQGLRHILPIYPFLIILAVFGWKKLWRQGKKWHLVLYGLLILYIGRTIYFLPHPITFTNEFLPPAKSYQVLADSNLSWGQELITIRNFQFSNSNFQKKKINLFYFGNIRVSDYLNNFREYDCGDYKSFINLIKQKKSPVLVSATCLQKMAGKNNKNILKLKPKEIITHSVLVY